MKQNTKYQIRLGVVFGDSARIKFGEYSLKKGPTTLWDEVDVTYHGRPVDALNAKEKQVLGLLIAAQGQLRSTGQLVSTFQDQGANASERIIHTNISNIRRKIKKQHPELPLTNIHHDICDFEGYKIIQQSTPDDVVTKVSQDVIRFGQCEMTKPSNRSWAHGALTIGGKTVRLQPRHRELMAALIERQGEALTSGDLEGIFPLHRTRAEKEGMGAYRTIYRIHMSEIQARIKRDAGGPSANPIEHSYSRTFPDYHLAG